MRRLIDAHAHLYASGAQQFSNFNVAIGFNGFFCGSSSVHT
jgi:predicted TIM-barrel fold metal-dependent hydrolase